MSTTWKSLAAGFAMGAVSTGFFSVDSSLCKLIGGSLWMLSGLYIGYQWFAARQAQS